MKDKTASEDRPRKRDEDRPRKRDEADDARRREKGLEALSVSLPSLTRKLFGKRGFAEGGLVREWSAIAGAELAAVTLPLGLAYPRRDRRTDGVLSLRVAPGHALTVQHLEPILIERVNGYLGCAAVARVKLRQGPLKVAGTRAPRPAPDLSPREETALRARTDRVDDEDLRGALERLGRAVLAGDKKAAAKKTGS